jgi:2,5-diketo-D-gluconate reductase B
MDDAEPNRTDDTGLRAPTPSGMPALGLGTYRNDDPEQCARTVRRAVEMGYRHVDTARMYGNERAVGEGLAAADVPTEDVFVATKLWYDELGHEEVLRAGRESRERLGVETIDLLYVHWPTDSYEPAETLPALAKLRAEGTIERIGVSNFEPADLDRAREILDDPPFANQVEMHPLLPQADLRERCGAHGVEVVAYAPVARGEVAEVPTLRAVAEELEATPYQVALAWLREKDVTPIPKATGVGHLLENLESLTLDLPPDAVARIDAIEERSRLIDPAFGAWNR